MKAPTDDAAPAVKPGTHVTVLPHPELPRF